MRSFPVRKYYVLNLDQLFSKNYANISSELQEMKKARRMFKQIDCNNIHETSQRVIAERAHATTRNLQTFFDGSTKTRNPSSRYRSHNERRTRRNKSFAYGINRQQPIGTRFSMSPMDELISVTRSKLPADNSAPWETRNPRKSKKV